MANHTPGDWRHLPHDPQAFFALEGDFDRKQLKRAYGALIRQFKPETHPNEFQRIRQAYEQLESRSRYGVEQKVAAQQTAAWQAIVAAEIAEAQAAAQASRNSTGQRAPSPPHQRAAPRPSVTQAAIDHPLETYQRLERQTSRSPQEYYVLAVLADLMGSKGQARFLSWLLAAVKAHPRDPGLLAILAEHLRSDVSIERAPAILLAVAGAVASDSFYRLTEPLWERLLRTRPFADFHNALRQCEQRVKQIDSRPRIVFYLRMLRPALWKADARWVDRAIAAVEKHGAELDSASEMDLEFILLVRSYQREDRGRIGDREVRRQLDDMIRGYCTGDWRSAAATVATVLDNLARDSHGVIAAFPMDAALDDETVDDRRLLTICLIIAGDVAEQTGADFDPGSEAKSQTQVAAALKDLGESLLPVAAQLNWLERRMYWLTLAGMIAPPLLLLGMMPVHILVFVLLFWAMAAALSFFLLLKPRYLDPRVNRGRQRIVLRAYEDSWRPRLFRYVQSCGHAGAALQRLHATSQVEGADRWMSIVLSYAEVDPGLLIFGRAQAFAT